MFETTNQNGLPNRKTGGRVISGYNAGQENLVCPMPIEKAHQIDCFDEHVTVKFRITHLKVFEKDAPVLITFEHRCFCYYHI